VTGEKSYLRVVVPFLFQKFRRNICQVYESDQGLITLNMKAAHSL